MKWILLKQDFLKLKSDAMTDLIKIKIKRLSEDFKDIPLPSYATEGSSGMDVRAAVKDKIVILVDVILVRKVNIFTNV